VRTCVSGRVVDWSIEEEFTFIRGFVVVVTHAVFFLRADIGAFCQSRNTRDGVEWRKRWRIILKIGHRNNCWRWIQGTEGAAIGKRQQQEFCWWLTYRYHPQTTDEYIPPHQLIPASTVVWHCWKNREKTFLSFRAVDILLRVGMSPSPLALRLDSLASYFHVVWL